MEVKHIYLIFGVTPTGCSNMIKKMLKFVVQKLTNNHSVKVRFPNAEKNGLL